MALNRAAHESRFKFGLNEQLLPLSTKEEGMEWCPWATLKSKGSRGREGEREGEVEGEGDWERDE